MKNKLYLIDFCNFSHAIFSDYWDENHESRAFCRISQKASISNDEFNLYIDGPFRHIGMGRDNLRLIFCLEEKADDRIKEYAIYCEQIGRSTIVVTNDRSLAKELKGLNTKVISCSDFNRKLF